MWSQGHQDHRQSPIRYGLAESKRQLVQQMLRCKTYVGKHYFDRTDSHTQRLNLRDQWVEMDAVAVIEENNFNVARQQLDQSNLNKTSPRQMHSPVLVTGRLGCEGLPRQNHANAKA